MLPTFAGLNHPQVAVSNAKFCRQWVSSFSARQPSQDLQHFCISQLATTVCFPGGWGARPVSIAFSDCGVQLVFEGLTTFPFTNQARCVRMFYVLRASNPFKIVWAVVCFYSISMIGLVNWMLHSDLPSPPRASKLRYAQGSCSAAPFKLHYVEWGAFTSAPLIHCKRNLPRARPGEDLGAWL